MLGKRIGRSIFWEEVRLVPRPVEGLVDDVPVLLDKFGIDVVVSSLFFEFAQVRVVLGYLLDLAVGQVVNATVPEIPGNKRVVAVNPASDCCANSEE